MRVEDLAEPLRAAAAALAPGQLSPVLQTDAGYVLLQAGTVGPLVRASRRVSAVILRAWRRSSHARTRAMSRASRATGATRR